MHSPWKRFWLELYTSKTWNNGSGVGRIVGTLIAVDITYFVVLAYKILYKNQPWNYRYAKGIGWFNLIVSFAFFLLTIYSIFKEKRGKEFLFLVRESIKGRGKLH